MVRDWFGIRMLRQASGTALGRTAIALALVGATTGGGGVFVLGSLERSSVQSVLVAAGASQAMMSGILDLPDHAVDGDLLVQAADTALYRAKELGRNRVEIACEVDAGDASPTAVARSADALETV